MPNRKPDRRRHLRHKRVRRNPPPLDYPASHDEPGGWPGSSPESGTRFSARRQFAILSVALIGIAVATLLADRALLSSSGNGPGVNSVPVVQPFPAFTGIGIPQTRQSSHPSHSAPAPVRSRSAMPSDSVAGPSPTSAATQPRQPIVVRYLVVQRQSSGFEGEVEVVNNGSSSLAGWQIVVALPNDEITSFQNASGYISNHILLLGPASGARPVGPGGVLRVFFVAEGQQVSPELCAFNNLICS
jgi:hypothetical protein